MSDPAQRLRNRASGSSLTVDYADVLAQAVDNEKWRVIREVIKILKAETVKELNGYSTWDTKPRPAESYRDSVLKQVNAL